MLALLKTIQLHRIGLIQRTTSLVERNALIQQHQNNNYGIKEMGSKPKVVQQESAEEIERKAKELAQKESNENSAVRRKNKQSTALGSLVDGQTVLSNAAPPKTKTGT